MKELHIDIETYSSVDIKKAGLYKYIESPDFEILLIAYALNDGPVQIIDLKADLSLLSNTTEKGITYFLNLLSDPDNFLLAHNAAFERLAFERKGCFCPPPRWICTMIKSAYCGLPLSLEQVSKALKLEEKGKASTGKALIRYFCQPCKPTKTNKGRTRNLPEHNPEKWEEFKQYCMQDVEAEREIHNRLKQYNIPEVEKELYILDQNINDRGIEIDIPFARNAFDIDTERTKYLSEKMKGITQIDNPNSPAQLKKWLSDAMEKEITTLAKDEIPILLEEAGPGAVTDVLKLRQKLSKSSTKKYTAMLNCVCNDSRAHGLFQLYGANRTGRWAGRLIQLQNLPQNKIKDLDLARQLVIEKDIDSLSLLYGDVPSILSQLIRTAFVAPEGFTFAVADFSAIEARVIAWLAKEQWRLDVFKTHGKIYEASASMMFGVPIEEVTKGSELRKRGKIAELALGYQGSIGALTQMGGEEMGLSESEMRLIVDKWRQANPKIVKFWKIIESAAKTALKNQNTGAIVYDLTFLYDGKVLTVELPSGRKLFYQSPQLGVNKFGNQSIQYLGVNQTTRQWGLIDTYGGKLVENITQAIARDLLAHAMLKLHKEFFDIVMHVHDEIVCEIYGEKAKKSLESMCRIMSEAPIWAEDLPLAAEGYLTNYYKKD